MTFEKSERAKGAEYVAEKGRDRERHLGRTTRKYKKQTRFAWPAFYIVFATEQRVLLSGKCYIALIYLQQGRCQL